MEGKVPSTGKVAGLNLGDSIYVLKNPHTCAALSLAPAHPSMSLGMQPKSVAKASHARVQNF